MEFIASFQNSTCFVCSLAVNEALLTSVYALPKLDVSVVAKDFIALVYQVVDAIGRASPAQ